MLRFLIKKSGHYLKSTHMENNQPIMTELKKKILKGLDLVSERLIEDAKKTNRELVVLQDNKVVTIKLTK